MVALQSKHVALRSNAISRQRIAEIAHSPCLNGRMQMALDPVPPMSDG